MGFLTLTTVIFEQGWTGPERWRQNWKKLTRLRIRKKMLTTISGNKLVQVANFADINLNDMLLRINLQ